MTSAPRICVVGSANVDLTFRTPRLPRPGETVAGTAFHLGMGGKGANQAVAAARLGASVIFIARVGNDTFGQEAIARYRADGSVVVTMGEQGAVLLADDAATHIPAESVKAVDPTGAGDAFTAAFAVALAEGLSLLDAARRARIVAAITVTRVGAQSAFPFSNELKSDER
jgi:ribokinase